MTRPDSTPRARPRRAMRHLGAAALAVFALAGCAVTAPVPGDELRASRDSALSKIGSFPHDGRPRKEIVDQLGPKGNVIIPPRGYFVRTRSGRCDDVATAAGTFRGGDVFAGALPGTCRYAWQPAWDGAPPPFDDLSRVAVTTWPMHLQADCGDAARSAFEGRALEASEPSTATPTDAAGTARIGFELPTSPRRVTVAPSSTPPVVTDCALAQFTHPNRPLCPSCGTPCPSCGTVVEDTVYAILPVADREMNAFVKLPVSGGDGDASTLLTFPAGNVQAVMVHIPPALGSFADGTRVDLVY